MHYPFVQSLRVHRDREGKQGEAGGQAMKNLQVPWSSRPLLEDANVCTSPSEPIQCRQAG